MRRIAALLLVLAVFACKRAEQPRQTSATPGARGVQKPRQAQKTTTGTEVGNVMPEYTASMLDGSPYDLASERGNVVLVNLWATWCGPCRYEIPELQQLHDRYGSRGFKVVGVSVDESGADAVKPFVEEQKMTYPVVLDPDGKLAGLLNTQVLPTTVLLDREGRIVWKKSSRIEITDAEMIQAIEKSL